MFKCVMTASLFAVSCFAGAKSTIVSKLKSGRDLTIVTYGTSLTHKGAWVKQVETAISKQGYKGKARFINSGQSGMYSAWGVKNYRNRVLDKKPDVVFIEFAINDSVARFNCSPEQAQKNLETIIDAILKQNPEAEVILMTMTPGDKYPTGHRSHRKDIEKYYEMYRSVAKKRKLLLIDIYPEWLAFRKKNPKAYRKLNPDTIHPTADGCAKIVTPTILKALGITTK